MLRASKLTRGGIQRALRVGAVVVKVPAAVVFDRDEWSCRLCFEGIDPNAVGPLQPSVDHRVPLERGGRHELGNLQATHLRCNLWKGQRTQAEVEGLLPLTPFDLDGRGRSRVERAVERMAA